MIPHEFLIQRTSNKTGKQGKCYNTCEKTPDFRFERNRAFFTCWEVSQSLVFRAIMRGCAILRIAEML